MMIFGIFLVLLGISLILKAFFQITIPLITTLVAVALIYFGLRMLSGNLGPRTGTREHWRTCWDSNCAMFSDVNFKRTAKEGPSEYNVAFGRGFIDLTGVRPEKEDIAVSVNVTFGSAEVLLDPAVPVRVHSNSVFAATSMPDESKVVFGSLNYKSPSAEMGLKPALNVRTNVVFGSLKVVNTTGTVVNK